MELYPVQQHSIVFQFELFLMLVAGSGVGRYQRQPPGGTAPPWRTNLQPGAVDPHFAPSSQPPVRLGRQLPGWDKLMDSLDSSSPASVSASGSGGAPRARGDLPREQERVDDYESDSRRLRSWDHDTSDGNGSAEREASDSTEALSAAEGLPQAGLAAAGASAPHAPGALAALPHAASVEVTPAEDSAPGAGVGTPDPVALSSMSPQIPELNDASVVSNDQHIHGSIHQEVASSAGGDRLDKGHGSALAPGDMAPAHSDAPVQDQVDRAGGAVAASEAGSLEAQAAMRSSVGEAPGAAGVGAPLSSSSPVTAESPARASSRPGPAHRPLWRPSDALHWSTLPVSEVGRRHCPSALSDSDFSGLTSLLDSTDLGSSTTSSSSTLPNDHFDSMPGLHGLAMHGAFRGSLVPRPAHGRAAPSPSAGGAGSQQASGASANVRASGELPQRLRNKLAALKSMRRQALKDAGLYDSLMMFSESGSVCSSSIAGD